MSVTTSQRSQVLAVYHRILRAAQTWTAKTGDPEQTATEKAYIREEARSLFKKYKQLTDPAEIGEKIREAEARLEIGLHYRNPYPRPVYAPPHTLAGTDDRKRQVVREKLRKEGKPIYIGSLRDE